MQNIDPKIPEVNYSMIFAAGLGTRMRPITEKIPKPMVEVKGKKLIDYAINSLKEAGIKNIVSNIYYKPEILEDYLGNHHPEVKLVKEEERLETGGGLINAYKNGCIKEDFCFCINSDIILQGDIKNALEEMRQKFFNSSYSSILLLCDIKNCTGYDGNGDFYIEDGELHKDSQNNNLVFSGMQLLNIKKVTEIDKKIFSLSEFFKREMTKKSLGYVIFTGNMLHIGDIEGLKLAENCL